MSETDELLLQILFRNYDEEVARNELIDNKNSQMIVLTGTMLTLQATLFTTGLLNDFVYDKIIVSPFKFWIFNLFVSSLIVSVVSMIFFILAFKFVGTFKQAPQAIYVTNSYGFEYFLNNHSLQTKNTESLKFTFTYSLLNILVNNINANHHCTFR